MDLESQIRALAGSGVYRAEAARILGLTRPQLTKICSILPDLRWSRPNRMVTGKPTPAALEQLRANLVKARIAKRAKAPKYTARGITGSLAELCTHFGVSATPKLVRQRITEGMSLDDALFTNHRKQPKIRDWSNVIFPCSSNENAA